MMRTSPRVEVVGLGRRTTQDPFAAWKRSPLRYVDGGVRFGAASWNKVAYGADAVASCLRGFNHDAPDPGCSCGFYGIKPGLLEPQGRFNWSFSTVRVEVEFLGLVVVHERGYRAERQRILRVTPEAKCSSPGCLRPPATVTLVPFLNVTQPAREPRPIAEMDNLRVDPMCDAHARGWGERFLSPWPDMSTADLAALLGTEVRFA